MRFICVADFTHKEADSLYTQTEEDQVGAYTGFPRQDGLPEWEEARLGHRIQEVGLLEGHNRLAAADGGGGGGGGGNLQGRQAAEVREAAQN